MSSALPVSAHYYTGGLAELVSNPSPLTFSFFRYWLCSSRSVGRAMRLLGLPYISTNDSFLEMVQGTLVVHAEAEERSLYSNTLFRYRYQGQSSVQPHMEFSPTRFFSGSAWRNTLHMLAKQVAWIANPRQILSRAESWIQSIGHEGERFNNASVATIEQQIMNHTLPVVIAVGYLAEFYAKTSPKSLAQVDAKQDWFFQSFFTREQVAAGTLSFSEYLQAYGLRSDNDYELSEPRWREEPERIQREIQALKVRRTLHGSFSSAAVPHTASQKSSAWNPVAASQQLRSQAKRALLAHVFQLRQALLREYDQQDLASLTREHVLKKEPEVGTAQHSLGLAQRHSDRVKVGNSAEERGKGMPVSQGTKEGVAHHIQAVTQPVDPNHICIFPNASPSFAQLYPQCQGIIFCSGGMTSHGAIVAREYGIPALIDGGGRHIPEGTRITINGGLGEWKVL